jgi:preprotein translocase subunit SecA
VLPTIDAKWDAVVHEAQRIHTTGRPILIGTRSVEASEQLAAKLSNAGLDHVVLNANRHAEEAAIVATAGEPGRITVATNMAGRGTDIRLSPEVAALGGLHVIATEHHDSARVDRQLFGRAARQGQPGAARLITSLDDPLLQRYLPTKLPLPRLRRLLPASAYHRAQHRATRLAMTRRRHVHLQDHQLDEQLGFAAD